MRVDIQGKNEVDLICIHSVTIFLQKPFEAHPLDSTQLGTTLALLISFIYQLRYQESK